MDIFSQLDLPINLEKTIGSPLVTLKAVKSEIFVTVNVQNGHPMLTFLLSNPGRIIQNNRIENHSMVTFTVPLSNKRKLLQFLKQYQCQCSEEPNEQPVNSKGVQLDLITDPRS